MADVKAEAGKGDLEDHAGPKRVPSSKVLRQKYPNLQDCCHVTEVREK